MDHTWERRNIRYPLLVLEPCAVSHGVTSPTPHTVPEGVTLSTVIGCPHMPRLAFGLWRSGQPKENSAIVHGRNTEIRTQCRASGEYWGNRRSAPNGGVLRSTHFMCHTEDEGTTAAATATVFGRQIWTERDPDLGWENKTIWPYVPHSSRTEA